MQKRRIHPLVFCIHEEIYREDATLAAAEPMCGMRPQYYKPFNNKAKESFLKLSRTFLYNSHGWDCTYSGIEL